MQTGRVKLYISFESKSIELTLVHFGRYSGQNRHLVNILKKWYGFTDHLFFYNKEERRVHSHSAIYGGNVLLPSPGMEVMAGNIAGILQKKCETDNNPHTFDLCKMKLTAFQSGEYEPEILEPVRGATAYLLHPMQLPDPNVGVMNLILTIEALMRADVRRINVVAPFIPFMRNDRRKDNKRVSISAKVVANMIQMYPLVGQVITLDLHADQEVACFDIPVDNIGAAKVFHDSIRRRYNGDLSNVIAVSPDIGSATRTRRTAKKLGVPLAIIDKDREGPGKTTVMGITGTSVKGKSAKLFDDMIDSGGTIINAANKLMDEGANDVEIYSVHAILSGDACAKFAKSGFKVRVTNSIPRSNEFMDEHASWLSYDLIDDLVANAIYESSLMRGSIKKLTD